MVEGKVVYRFIGYIFIVLSVNYIFYGGKYIYIYVIRKTFLFCLFLIFLKEVEIEGEFIFVWVLRWVWGYMFVGRGWGNIGFFCLLE